MSNNRRQLIRNLENKLCRYLNKISNGNETFVRYRRTELDELINVCNRHAFTYFQNMFRCSDLQLIFVRMASYIPNFVGYELKAPERFSVDIWL